jgi:hypothetical protein
MSTIITIQNLLHQKVFGDHLSLTRPLEYRRQEWQELGRARERSVRLIIRALLGVPSAHQTDRREEHAMWCFQFPNGSLLVVHLRRGTHVEFAARVQDEAEVHQAVDFLIQEVSNRLRSLQEG